MKQPISRELPATHMANPARPWIPSRNTNVAKTFERIRAAQGQQPVAKVIKIR